MKKILLTVGIILVVIAIVIPLVVSVVIVPGIKRASYSGFPSDPAQRKEYVFKNSEPWDQSKQLMKYFGYLVPSDSELEKLKSITNLTRHYPETLKAVFSPGPLPNTVELLYFGNELADLGVNTYWVIGEYRIKDNYASQFMSGFNQAGFPGILSQDDAKKVLAWRILLAKK